MKKKSATSLVDDHLQSLAGMQEAQTDDFFYTRLKARMQKGVPQREWNFPLRPAWVIGGLILLLAVNGFMLTQQPQTKTPATATSSSPLQQFAQSYDQTIASAY